MAIPWAQRRIHLNTCGTVLCEPDWSWHPRPSADRDFDLWFVWAGRGVMRFEETRIELGPGDAFCLRPWVGYDATHDPHHRLGVCYLHFEFDGPVRRGQRRSVDLPPHHCRLSEIDLHERNLRHAVTLAASTSAAQRGQAAALVQATLLAMQAAAEAPALAGVAREHDERIRAVMRRVREEPGRIYSVDELAASAAYSVDHFTRLFKSVAGLTPKEFCIRVRLERAQLLLRESPMSIEQIAANLGYADVFFFSRQFKQRLGAAPSVWRQAGSSAV